MADPLFISITIVYVERVPYTHEDIRGQLVEVVFFSHQVGSGTQTLVIRFAQLTSQ